ncbi:MAG: ATP-dependent helicase [Candidatus Pacearchaeota archaeon]
MTQTLKAKKRNSSAIKKAFHPLVQEWFFSKFEEFSESQKYGVMNVHERKNTLISAPTGGGKTLTAFLSILNRLVRLAEKGELENRVYALYCSPLKALSNDIHSNLIEPLEEIREIAKSKGIKLQDIRVGLRTGDTTASEKAKMARKPPHIMITTPESMAIVLTTKKFIEAFRNVEYCITDEIHSLGNKRGTYLSLSWERLNELSETWPAKIGLSATVEPLEEVAKFLVGNGEDRTVYYAKASTIKSPDIDVLTPASDLVEDENPYLKTYPMMHDMIQKHGTTLVFTNTRSGTERIVNQLKDKYPEYYSDENIAAHHSSLGKDYRFNIEQSLRDGKLKTVVCSTSLELGIDIGHIDLVILLGSPKASSRALQRIGRAGHQLHSNPKGRFIVLDRDDLVECSVIQKEMVEGKIDLIQFPHNALDVLSQQIYGMAINRPYDIDELLKLIRSSYCYQDLSKEDYMSVISYLSGEYELEGSSVYSKIWHDKENNTIGKRGKLARTIYMTNIGTIPEESYATVKLSPSGEQIGVIDEGFLSRMKKMDVFVLGGKKYTYKYTKGMNLYVTPSPEKSPTIPSWFSESLPLSFDSGLAINEFRKKIRKMFDKKKSKKEILKKIMSEVYVSEKVAKEIFSYFQKQYYFAEFPDSENITIEKYVDERDNKKYILVNSMYGRRVNDALSRVIAYVMGSEKKRDLEIGITDRGFYISSENMDIEGALEQITNENVEELAKEAIEKTDILTRRFRHCASRGMMIIKTYKGNRKSVKKQQMKSHFLISAVKKISNNFPILKEAKREVLEDLMDIKNTKQVIEWVKNGKIKIKSDYVKIPSPFALGTLLQGHMDLMKVEEKQEFLRRMYEIYSKEIKNRGEDDYQDIGDLEYWKS